MWLSMRPMQRIRDRAPEALPYLQIFPTEEVTETETTNENTSDDSYDDQANEGADNSDNGTSDDDE